MAYQRGGYWYESRREAGRVVTDYLGNSDAARLVAEWVNLEQAAVREERRRARMEEQRDQDLDDQVESSGELVQALTHAILLCQGYHTHKGQWRKQRG